MPRKKKQIEENEEAPASGIVSDPVEEYVSDSLPEWVEPKTASKVPPKLSLPLKGDGSIDLEGMRSSTVDKLRIALAGTKGLQSEQATPARDPSQVPDFMVQVVYSLIGSIEVAIMSRKYPRDIAQQAFTYTPADLEVLTEPTKAVLAKYLPLLGKYNEEAALLMALGSIHIQKMAVINAYMARRVPDAT